MCSHATVRTCDTIFGDPSYLDVFVIYYGILNQKKKDWENFHLKKVKLNLKQKNSINFVANSMSHLIHQANSNRHSFDAHQSITYQTKI